MGSVKFAEWLCNYDDELMLRLLENGMDATFVVERLRHQILCGNVVLAMVGSALQQFGVLELLDIIGKTLPLHEVKGTDFAAIVFKVIHDSKGNRVTFLKCLSGGLKVRDEVVYGKDICNKVHEIREYQGKTYTNVSSIQAGDIVGITGLSNAVAGMGLGTCEDLPAPVLRPVLKAAVLKKDASHDSVMDCLRKLEAQDPLLSVSYEPSLQQINVSIMGKIQLEILKDLILERFGLDIDFGKCQVVYRETVEKPVMGYGHFEPLRHYAEVHLRLEPNPHGGFAFESELHTDRLAKQYQNLIHHHILERNHKGILTGSSLTDIRFVLTNAAIHLKHTEGGDLREATYRAVRQGLEKAESVLLEPYYEFLIDVDSVSVGRVLSDITRLHGEFEPPETIGERVRIKGRGPVETFIDYSVDLLSFTKGTGAVSLSLLDYFP